MYQDQSSLIYFNRRLFLQNCQSHQRTTENKPGSEHKPKQSFPPISLIFMLLRMFPSVSSLQNQYLRNQWCLCEFYQQLLCSNLFKKPPKKLVNEGKITSKNSSKVKTVYKTMTSSQSTLYIYSVCNRIRMNMLLMPVEKVLQRANMERLNDNTRHVTLVTLNLMYKSFLSWSPLGRHANNCCASY